MNWTAFLILAAAAAGVGATYLFWWRTLNTEHGPAMVATAATIGAFIALVYLFLFFQTPE